MDKIYYNEMAANLELLVERNKIQGRTIFLFGHCNASEILADLLSEKGYRVKAFLDNNISKHWKIYNNIPVMPAEEILREDTDHVLVCIVARASAAIESQLKKMGYKGAVEKLIEYNSYAEYSLSEETIMKKQNRVERGMKLLDEERKKYPGCYRIYCPFSALGDVYYMMSYLFYFLERKGVLDYVIFTVGNSCKDVVELFGVKKAEALSQVEMDESIQAILYTNDIDAYIPHQDRPYVVNLAKALYIKKIPLELLYKYGVFGLNQNCCPHKPINLKKYSSLERIIPGKAVVLSPYAKSVTNIPRSYWYRIIEHYKDKKYQIFTNIVRDERALPGTLGITIRLSEIQTVVERAGTFIGLRSGLCDVIKDAVCQKIALYPDCYYSDTEWKMEEIYHLNGWKNIVVY